MLCNGSAGIRSVVDDEVGKSSGPFSSAMCNACETAVVWMHTQLAQNQTQDLVLQYIDQVCFLACKSNAAVHYYTNCV